MTYQLLLGNCLETLKTIPDGSIQTVITSPPYFGLRDYGTAKWVGGDDPTCNHTYQKGGRNPETSKGQLSNAGTLFYQYEKVCKRCGALRVDDQIGIEESPDAYVAKLVEVFRECRRCLADDGTLWLNLGDSYAGSGKGGQSDEKRSANWQPTYANQGSTYGLKPKDLIGIPWATAFALRADGWWLRSEIIWHKKNTMPEPVTDRPTKSHEHIFLLSKSAQYYYDADAIKEPLAEQTKQRNKYGHNGAKNKAGAYAVSRDRKPGEFGDEETGRNKRDVWVIDEDEFGQFLQWKIDHGGDKQDVWNLSTSGYKGAHFATFPEEIPETCILASTKPGDKVLDPFNGSGTTGAVAIKYHRGYVGCELNPEYIDLTHKRFAQVQPVLFQLG